MFALYYTEYGDPSVLKTGDLPEPHAVGAQIRIAVQSAAVNPFDWKLRSGAMAGMVPEAFPAIPGLEASGVVDEVGPDALGVAIGDEVFGLGNGTNAQFAVLDHFALKPSSWTWQQAAAAPLAAEAALRALRLLELSAGQTLLIDNASGSVGTAAAQFARAEGIHVVGTASADNHDRLRAIGVVPVTYGPGLSERVAAVTSARVDGVIDLAGTGSLPELIEIAGSDNVVSLADFTAPALGVRVSTEANAFDALERASSLAARGDYDVAIDRGFHFNDAAAAHQRSQDGHTSGKIVFGE